jgi:hypothetical protein
VCREREQNDLHPLAELDQQYSINSASRGRNYSTVISSTLCPRRKLKESCANYSTIAVAQTINSPPNNQMEDSTFQILKVVYKKKNTGGFRHPWAAFNATSQILVDHHNCAFNSKSKYIS